MNYKKLIGKITPIELLELFRTIPQRDVSEAAFQASCKRVARQVPIKLENVISIIDNSSSMIGPGENKYRPISVAESIAGVLFHASFLNITFGEPNKTIFLSELKGQFNPSKSIKRMLKMKPNYIFIITPDLKPEVLLPLHKKLRKEQVRIIHIDPFWNNPLQETKDLSDFTDSYNIRNIEQISLLPIITMIKRMNLKERRALSKYLRKSQRYPQSKKISSK